MTFTGNTRYRVGFAGKIILQLEYTMEEWDGQHRFSVKKWRDAKADDLINKPLAKPE